MKRKQMSMVQNNSPDTDVLEQKKNKKDKSLKLMKKLEKRHEKKENKVKKKNGEKLPKQKKSKKFIFATIAVCLVLVIAGGGCAYYFLIYRTQNTAGNNNNNGFGNMSFSEDTVSATGTTSIGILSEEFEPDYLETSLYIEEVYVSTGDEIEEGTKLLKISDDTLAEAMDELESAANDADLAYRAGVIEYEQSKISAQYDYDITVLEGQQAQAVYDETVATLESQLEDAQDAVDEAQEQIDEYEDALANDTYYEEYQVEETLYNYNENLAILNYESSLWGIPFSAYSTGSNGGGSYDQWELTTLNQLYAEVQENETEYEQAQEDYDNAVANATLELQKLYLSIETLNQTLIDTQENYETQMVAAETTYKTALAKSEMAQDDYDTAMDKAEEDYNSLVDAKEDADDNLSEFTALLGDGYLYASNNGTVVRVQVSADSYLQSESMVVAYSDNDVLTVSVDVDQADISKIEVGDSAYVMIEDYGNYTGVIESINPVSDSTSRTSITYEVIVSLENTDTELTSNLTADVYFNMGGTEQ